MLVGQTSGDSFEYTFSGRGIGLFVIAGPDAGVIEKDVQPTHEDVQAIVARAMSDYREFDAIKAAVIKKRRAELATMRKV